MYKLQEMLFKLNNDMAVEVHLISLGDFFTADIIYPVVPHALSKTISELNLNVPAAEAFRVSVSDVVVFAKSQNAVVVDIDNPCNTEFLDKSDQLTMLGQLQITVPVKVNGV